MANKDLRFEAHRIISKGTVRDDIWIYEDNNGLWVFIEGGKSFNIPWSRIRAALKRKDKK